MAGLWDMIWNAFRNYMGVGFVPVLYALALLYLFLREKRREVRVILVFLPLATLALYFVPLLAGAVRMIGEEEVYYRFLWLLPVTVTLAYTAVQIIAALPGRGRIPAAIVLAGAFILSGRLIYKNVEFHRAQNLEHVPQSVVDICDALVIPGREVMVAFPEEMVQFARQYTALVCMPYGREVLVRTWGKSHPLYEQMSEDVIIAEKICALGHEYRCHYLVISQGKGFDGDMADYGFQLTGAIDGYWIFRSVTEDFTVP